MTLFPKLLHFVIKNFWIGGTSSKGISTPKSPLATMIPSHTSHISSMLSTPLLFSILAMISIFFPPFSFKKLRRSTTSCFLDTKEAATKSTSFLIPNNISDLSISLRYGWSRTFEGKFILLRSERTPPVITSQIALFPSIFLTEKITRPLLTKILSLTLSSWTKWE